MKYMKALMGSNRNNEIKANQKEAMNSPISGLNEKIIYSNSNTMNSNNPNELVRRLLSGVTTDELRRLVKIREETRRPIPAPRRKQREAGRPIPTPRRMCPWIGKIWENRKMVVLY